MLLLHGDRTGAEDGLVIREVEDRDLVKLGDHLQTPVATSGLDVLPEGIAVAHRRRTRHGRHQYGLCRCLMGCRIRGVLQPRMQGMQVCHAGGLELQELQDGRRQRRQRSYAMTMRSSIRCGDVYDVIIDQQSGTITEPGIPCYDLHAANLTTECVTE